MENRSIPVSRDGVELDHECSRIQEEIIKPKETKDQKCNNNLKSALFSPLDKRRYKCNICEKKFLCKRKVARHIRTHTDEKKFCCHICAVKFRWKSCLQRHMRRHGPIESESEPDPEPSKVNCNLFKL